MKIITIAALVSCTLQVALGIECLEFKDSQDDSIRYWKIEGDKGTITEAGFCYVENFKLYSGFLIEYQKKENRLNLRIIGNIFEGFMEFETGQFSPVMASSISELVIENIESDWTEIKIKGRDPILVRWVDATTEDLKKIKL